MFESMAIVDGWKNSSVWSTELLPSGKQFERWCEFVNEAHLRWSIERGTYDNFPAFIREGRFGDFRMANLTAAPRSSVRGTRRQPEIAQDSYALYNFLYIAEGSERLIIDGKDVDLVPGNIVLWDSARPMIFITGEGLHQITLAITHERLHRIFPNAEQFVGMKISCSSGLNRLFADHLLALDQQFGELTSEQAWAVLDTTTNLAVSAFESECGSYSNARVSGLLCEIRNYIEKNIEDCDLSIAKIAEHHNISVRHLHRLFHEIDISASAYITRRRLERCKQDLSSRAHGRETITDIAFRWGFSDSGTFSKTFRREYGLSPREFRATAQN